MRDVVVESSSISLKTWRPPSSINHYFNFNVCAFLIELSNYWWLSVPPWQVLKQHQFWIAPTDSVRNEMPPKCDCEWLVRQNDKHWLPSPCMATISLCRWKNRNRVGRWRCLAGSFFSCTPSSGNYFNCAQTKWPVILFLRSGNTRLLQ